MRLNSLILSNIRSYQSCEVEFPSGIVLLSGDIGAGKSTLLHAIEFALFGVRRSDLSGESLLRHGESRGSVSLNFSLGKNVVEVSRVLKRTKDGVRQDSGVLTVHGSSEELTALELRARIMELLGYPQSLLTKNKDVLFRYTVYTPQEEMKRILTDSSTHRLDALRTVFGIDTYKTILENASSVIKSFRDDQRFLQGQVSDVESLSEHVSELHSQMSSVSEELESHKKQLSVAQQEYDEASARLEEFSKQKEAYSSYTQLKKAYDAQVASIDSRISALKAILSKTLTPPSVVSDPSEKKQKLNDLKATLLAKQAALNTKEASLRSELAKKESSLNSITSLTVCPTCQQEVGSDHKEHIKESLGLSDVRAQLDELSEKKHALESKEQTLLMHTQQLVASEHAYARYLQQKQTYEQSLYDKKRAQEELDSISKPTPPTPVSFDMESYTAAKTDCTKKQAVVASHKESVASKKATYAQLAKQAESLKESISKKRSSQKRLEELLHYEDWLKQCFVPAISEVESRVFASIHREFSSQFTRYIMLLLEDTGLFATLDSSFAPVITQDGYDVGLESLSGGERQSVSLAYRLALNHTINRLVSALKTNGLLILDEPTDGLSADQLLRVRDVIRSTDFEQLLIVSHDPAVHSFVDAVLYVRKDPRGSVVVSP